MSVKYIAHRGCPRRELENTVESFIAAGNKKYYGIESDVTMISDGNVIIYHDDDLKRLAGISKQTRELTIEEAKLIKLTGKGTYHTYDYKIPSPLEYIRICKHYDKVPVIDVK